MRGFGFTLLTLSIVALPIFALASGEKVTIDTFAQVPFDWNQPDTGFDLDRIEEATEDNNPVFGANLAIPYEELEKLIDGKLSEFINTLDSDQPDGFKVDYDFDGGNVKVKFDFEARFEFVETKQPYFGEQKSGDVEANKIQTILDNTSFKVTLNVDAKITTEVLGVQWPEEEVNADLEATVGLNTLEDLTLYPDVSVKNFKLTLPLGENNLGIRGIDDLLVELSSSLGAALPITGDPFTSALAYLVGEMIGKDYALDEAEKRVAEAITKELEKASKLVEEEVTKRLKIVDEFTAKKNDVMENFVIPQLNMTPNKFMEDLGGEEKLYTQATGNDVKFLAQTRFKDDSEDIDINGAIFFPRFKCVYFGNSMTGQIAKLEPVNRDIAEGTKCDDLLRATMPVVYDMGSEETKSPGPADLDTTPDKSTDSLLNRVGGWIKDVMGRLNIFDQGAGNKMLMLSSDIYLGGNPRTYIGNATSLQVWKPLGNMSTKGNVVIKDASVECPIRISGLRESAILRLRASGTLAERMGAGKDDTPPLDARFYLKKKKLLDHVGEPVPPVPLTLVGESPSFDDATFSITGGVVPKLPMQCPGQGGGQKPDVDPGDFSRPGVTPDPVDIRGDGLAPVQIQKQIIR